MKTKKSMILCFTTMVSFIFILVINIASALEYNVTIYNNTGNTSSQASVTVYAKDAMGNVTTMNAIPLSISNNGNAVASMLAFTGGPCPSYLTGTVGSETIAQMSCNGTEGTTQGRCCGSPTFNIIKKNGMYHFQK